MASMRQAKLADDIFGSSATDNFREMADARTADSLASIRQFGIADLAQQQFRGLLRGPPDPAGGTVRLAARSASANTGWDQLTVGTQWFPTIRPGWLPVSA